MIYVKFFTINIILTDIINYILNYRYPELRFSFKSSLRDVGNENSEPYTDSINSNCSGILASKNFMNKNLNNSSYDNGGSCASSQIIDGDDDDDTKVGSFYTMLYCFCIFFIKWEWSLIVGVITVLICIQHFLNTVIMGLEICVYF